MLFIKLFLTVASIKFVVSNAVKTPNNPNMAPEAPAETLGSF